MTVEDIPALIAELRDAATWERAYQYPDEYVGGLLDRMAAAMETVTAERDALRAENRKLIDKLETAMGVSEECDALTKKLRQIDEFATWGALPIPTRDRIRNILSRAIDTKEQS